MASGTNARLAVGHVAADADPIPFVPTDTLWPDAAGRWQRMAATVDLPPQRRLAVSCFSVNQVEAQMHIDSLAATRGVSPTLSALSAHTLALGGTTATVEYGPAPFLQGNGDTATVGPDGLVLHGLQAETEYWVYTREDSTTLTCMPPARITMPAEAALPFCMGTTPFSRLQLPELAVDTLSRLHLYLTLQGPCQLQAGVMERNGDWDHLAAVDTVALAAGQRQQVHIALGPYSGNGRFVGLRSLGTDIVMADLVATACPWVTAQLLDDNSLLLLGQDSCLGGLFLRA
jgi:hypothetical protein